MKGRGFLAVMEYINQSRRDLARGCLFSGKPDSCGFGREQSISLLLAYFSRGSVVSSWLEDVVILSIGHFLILTISY